MLCFLTLRSYSHAIVQREKTFLFLLRPLLFYFFLFLSFHLLFLRPAFLFSPPTSPSSSFCSPTSPSSSFCSPTSPSSSFCSPTSPSSSFCSPTPPISSPPSSLDLPSPPRRRNQIYDLWNNQTPGIATYINKEIYDTNGAYVEGRERGKRMGVGGGGERNRQTNRQKHVQYTK